MPGVTQRHLGLTRGPPVAQAASWHGLPLGRAHRVPGAHRPHLQVFLLPIFLSLSPKTRVLHLFLRSCCSWRRFLISLYNPSFELRFLANTPWYVTPPP